MIVQNEQTNLRTGLHKQQQQQHLLHLHLLHLHQHLLHRIKHYKIDDLVMTWIKSWLTQCRQSVVVDGTSSPSVSVLSGISQGSY